jgi:hypothetical protein
LPLYYFNLSFGERILPDDEGIELADREAAREEAHAVIRDLAKRENRRRWASWFVDVTDEQGSFLRLPIGYPALEVLPKVGHRRQAAVPGFKLARRAAALDALPEGLAKNGPAALVHERLALRKQTAALLEHNRQLREELSLQFSTSEQIRRRTRGLLSSARFLGWLGEHLAAGPDDNGRPHGAPRLVLLRGGAGD